MWNQENIETFKMMKLGLNSNESKIKLLQTSECLNTPNFRGDYWSAYCRLLAKLRLVILLHLFDIIVDADSALSNGDYWSPWRIEREIWSLDHDAGVGSTLPDVAMRRSIFLHGMDEPAIWSRSTTQTSDILYNYMEALFVNDIFICRLLHIRFRLYIYTVA